MAKRKHRKDRNHIIYKLTCECTGDTYIGVTVVQNRKAQKSLRGRWLRHIHKAVVGLADYPISQAIRTFGEESFTREILHIIRGKAAAFEFEANLINEIRPTLNTKMIAA